MTIRHVIYKLTNKINGKIYIGKYSGESFDYYYGSGVLIAKAIKKYGKTSFNKEILFEFSNEQDAWAKEEELVNAEYIAKGNTYNLALGGGTGGARIMAEMWKDPNSILNSKEFRERRHLSQIKAKSTLENKLAQSKIAKKSWSDPNSGLNSVERSEKLSKGMVERYKNPNYICNTDEYKKKLWKKLNSPECKKKNSDSRKKSWADPNSKYRTEKMQTQEYRDKLSKTITESWKKRKEKNKEKIIPIQLELDI